MSVALLLVVGALISACAGTVTTPAATTTVTVTATPESPGSATQVPSAATSGLATISVDELPPEARQVLDLVAADGPYPYPQDGQTFQNREGILPPAPYGAYHEYTVETPGSPDRGARRLVISQTGAVFYTDDHYGSFQEVIP